MKTFTIGRKTFLRIDRQHPCPICGKPDWCFLDSSQTKAYCCRRLDENRPSIAGATEYDLTENQKYDVHIETVAQEEMASANRLHKVYSLVLPYFSLTDQHTAHLIFDRGFTLEEIEIRGFASFTHDAMRKQIKSVETVNGRNTGKTIWEDLFESNGLPRDAWRGVPGFFYSEEHQTPIFQAPNQGIFIPNRNAWGQIIGGQIRVDPEHIRYKAVVNSIWEDKVLVRVKNIGGHTFHYSIYDRINYELIDSGETQKKRISFQNGISFEIKAIAKYVWLSTSSENRGCGANSMPHYSFPSEVLKKATFDENGKSKVHLLSLCKNIIVTEGLLKGDIIAAQVPMSQLDYLGSTLVVSMAGVNIWKKAADSLLKYTKTEEIYLAFDSDFKMNDAVYEALKQTIQYFQEDGTRNLKLLDWEVEKGLDDFLLNSQVAYNYTINVYDFS